MNWCTKSGHLLTAHKLFIWKWDIVHKHLKPQTIRSQVWMGGKKVYSNTNVWNHPNANYLYVKSIHGSVSTVVVYVTWIIYVWILYHFWKWNWTRMVRNWWNLWMDIRLDIAVISQDMKIVQTFRSNFSITLIIFLCQKLNTL